MDPFTEMVIGKVSELAFESIPGGLAQAIFVLNGGNWTTAAILSIGLSCLSTAFTATMLEYDLDTNAAKRKKNPEFYGYMPDTSAGRVFAFALLFVYHSAWTLGKTVSMAVLAQANWMWLVAYLLADHGGFILYKLARGDLIYWVPGFGFPLSLLARFMAKIATDFSGCVQARHPFELGGFYFLVNALMSVASWFVAAALYSRYFPAGATELALEAGMKIASSSTFANATGANSHGANPAGAASTLAT